MEKFTKINLEQGSPTSPPKPPSRKKINPLYPILAIAVVLGLTSGFLFAKKRLVVSGISGTTNTLTQNPVDSSSVKVGDIFGSSDEKTFRDTADGIIQPGGISGEGSHHLVRGANESQWVYLTSSVIDLDNFVGTKVSIWGETIGAKKAGWLMDVGRLKVLELNAAEVDALEPTQ